jgi:hypothetical protein
VPQGRRVRIRVDSDLALLDDCPVVVVDDLDGSSIVTMCARRVRLMWPIIDAIVVVLPVPVGPVTSTSPGSSPRAPR